MEFSQSDESLIRNMMLSKSFRDIAIVVGCDKTDIQDFVAAVTAGTDIVVHQTRLDNLKASQPPRAPRGADKKVRKVPVRKSKKVGKEKAVVKQKVIKEQRETNIREVTNHERRREKEKILQKRSYKTAAVNYLDKVSIRIDSKTIIYSNPGEEEETKARFIKNYGKYINRLL